MSNTKNTSESQNSQQSSRKSQNSSRSSRNSTEDDSKQTGDTPAKERRPSPMEVLRQARDQFAELTGLTVESVSSFGQTEAGWTLEVEVLELERVPDTMSLLASYQVEIDSQGQLAGYRRVRRYERGRADVRGSGGR